MLRVCYVCHKAYGVKPPLEDESVTHGLCNDHYLTELARVQKEIDEMIAKEKSLEQKESA